jgi:PAS domain-containing protein
MNLDIVLSTLLIFSAACYVLLGIRLIVSKREVGSVPIGVLFVIISFWVMGGAVELMSESFLVFSIGRTGHFIGTALLPLAALVCFREYTGTTTPLRTIVLLLIVPTVSIALAATNQFHQFMWQLPAVNENGQFLTRPDQWGPWFLFVHAPHSYALIAAAMFTLLVHSSAVAPAHRRGLFLLVAACVGPLIATAAYDLGVGSNVISFVPLVFAAMLPIYAWLIVGEGIVEFTPLAYETVFQNMQDPVIVIDEQQRIIGLNHCAETMLAVSEQEALRTPLDEIFKDGATVVFEALETQKPQKMMTTTGRFLHIQVSPIQSDRSSVRGGRVLMFRDVSDVEKAQSEVRKSEKLLRTLIDHSVNGVIRLRWVQDEDYGGKDLRCIFANAAAGRFLDSETDDLVDLKASEIARRAMTGMDAHTQRSILEQLKESCEAGDSVDVELLQSTGDTLRWLRMICEPVGDDIAATFIDVTDSKAKERQMESIAWSDPLTGVLNRRGFERDAAVHRSQRVQGYQRQARSRGGRSAADHCRAATAQEPSFSGHHRQARWRRVRGAGAGRLCRGGGQAGKTAGAVSGGALQHRGRNDELRSQHRPRSVSHQCQHADWPAARSRPGDVPGKGTHAGSCGAEPRRPARESNLTL